jgi:hypothetical protein
MAEEEKCRCKGISHTNLMDILKLHKLIHRNNGYFDSFHTHKFQFYSQLIESYLNLMSTQQVIYLFLHYQT